MLKWAIKNSEKKGYHSALDVMKLEESLSSDKKKLKEKLELSAKMTSGEEQFKKLGEKVPSYSSFITIKQVPNPDKKG